MRLEKLSSISKRIRKKAKEMVIKGIQIGSVVEILGLVGLIFSGVFAWKKYKLTLVTKYYYYLDNKGNIVLKNVGQVDAYLKTVYISKVFTNSSEPIPKEIDVFREDISENIRLSKILNSRKKHEIKIDITLKPGAERIILNKLEFEKLKKGIDFSVVENYKDAFMGIALEDQFGFTRLEKNLLDII